MARTAIKPKATELVEQIKNAKGNISAVARAYKVSRTAVYQWIEATATAKQALADERETMVDVAESALYRNVVQGENSAIFYVLNNSPEAKRRGWGPKIEHSGDVSLVVKRLKGDASMDNI
jgi:hypothetical protein